MRARPAEIQTPDGRRVARPAEQWARNEELVERQLAVENMSAGQPEGPLEIERGDDLPRDDRRFEARRVCRDGARGRVTEPIALGVPRRAAQVIRGELDVRRDHVGARRSERGVADGRNRQLDPGLPGVTSIFRRVERALDGVEVAAKYRSE